MRRHWWVRQLLLLLHPLLPHELSPCFFFLFTLWVWVLGPDWHSCEVDLRAENILFLIARGGISTHEVLLVLLEGRLEGVLIEEHFDTYWTI